VPAYSALPITAASTPTRRSALTSSARRNPAAGDDGNVRPRDDALVQLDVRPVHRAVASNRRHQEPRGSGVEEGRDRRREGRSLLAPPAHHDTIVSDVDGDDHALAQAADGVGDGSDVERRGGPDDRASGASREDLLRVGRGAQAAADLHRHGDGAQDADDDVSVRALAERGV
jgi:hypothetical protein